MTVYTTKTIVVIITGTNGDFAAAFDNYNIGIDGEHLKTKLDIVLPTAWNVFIGTDPASFISVEYRNAKGRCGRSANIAVPALITTHISYEIPRDALYAPETEFWFSVYQDIDGTESRITKTAIVKCNVANGYKAGTVPAPFGHDIIQQLVDVDAANYAALNLLKIDKNFTTSTNEVTLLSTDIIPINKSAGTLKKTTLQTLSTWLGETITHAFTTTAQTIKGAINELKADLTNLSFTGSAHDALVTAALVDVEGTDFGENGLATYLDGRLDKWEQRQIDIIISVKDYGAIGNANYFNAADKLWYVDIAYTTLAADDTAAIQSALNAKAGEQRFIVIPDGNYQINPHTKLSLLSDTYINFSQNAVLVAKTSNEDVTSMLDIVSVNNITLINPTIIGDREHNTSVTEGAGHGITIRHVDNIHIRGANVSDCFTDGIYCLNVDNCLIEDSVCDNNRRQGMSLVYGRNFRCVNSTFKNTNGVSPGMGIDIEPNNSDEWLENIRFENITTENNETAGIGINIADLDDADTIVDIIIDGWTDYNSNNAFTATMYAGEVSESSKILVKNMRSLNAGNAAVVIAAYQSTGSPRLILEKPIIYNPNTLDGTNERVQNVGISITSESSNFVVGTVIGNVEIIEPKITMSGVRTIFRGIYVGYVATFEKIIIRDPIEIQIGDEAGLSDNSKHGEISFNGAGANVKVFDRYHVLELETDVTLIKNFTSSAYSKIKSTATSGTIALTDFISWTHIEEFLIFNGTNTTMNITLSSTRTYYDESGNVVTGIYSTTTTGAILQFSQVESGKFLVKEIYGTWTVA